MREGPAVAEVKLSPVKAPEGDPGPQRTWLVAPAHADPGAGEYRLLVPCLIPGRGVFTRSPCGVSGSRAPPAKGTSDRWGEFSSVSLTARACLIASLARAKGRTARWQLMATGLKLTAHLHTLGTGLSALH